MDIPLNATVLCRDGEGGHSACVIIDPIKDQMTHLVVKGKGILSPDHLVPIHFIIETSEDRITLSCLLADLAKMEPFTEAEFLPYSISGGYAWPYFSSAEAAGILLEHERIPVNELAIHRGDAVLASDGVIGRVDGFIIDPATDSICYLIMREGHFWGQKDVTIPVSQINRIVSESVYLKITKKQIEGLPAVPVKWGK